MAIKRLRCLLGLVFGLGLVWALGQFLPPQLSRTLAMERYDSQHFSVWAEAGDRRAAIELRTMLEDRGGRALAFLEIPDFPATRTEVFLYPDRWSFAVHRGGLWSLFSDSVGIVATWLDGRILLVSPGNPGLGNTSDQVLRQTLAVWVRRFLPPQSEGAKRWLTDGTVAYLADFSRDDENPGDLPKSLALSETSDLGFLAHGGDRFADSFVAWVIYRYGNDILLQVLNSGSDWRRTTGQNLDAAASEWRNWVIAGRPWDPRLGIAYPPGTNDR